MGDIDAAKHAQPARATTTFPFNLGTAARCSTKYLTADGAWGRMELGRWSAFVDFLSASSILVDREKAPIPREKVDAAALFTNDLLP